MYTLMGYASWRVWNSGVLLTQLPLVLYMIQLVLNLLWQPLFFIKHDLKAASIDITGAVGPWSACGGMAKG